MDLFVDPREPRAASTLRQEIGAYLRRHASDVEQVDDAELAVSELLGNAVRHAEGPVWVSLDWSMRNPVLTIYDMGEDSPWRRRFRMTSRRPDEGSSW